METEVLQSGAPLDVASAAVILMHGRGATAGDILSLTQEFDVPEISYLAPQAPGFTWYPYSFLTPIQQNEPQLSQSLGILGNLLDRLENSGFSSQRVLLLGFSQGACLSLEYAARNPRYYGGVAALSGGLIGPPGCSLSHSGSLEGTPVFLGCSERDPHIPTERVLESERILRAMGAQVTTRLYPNLGHTINEDELDFVREMIHLLMELET